MMPEELIDYKHVIENIEEDDYKSKIESLLLDNEMRKTLENNAFDYYQKHLKPEKVIEKLVSKVSIR